ncbi:MAG: YfcC family protein [Actinobacteria bacterium]|nr:YfcC family protein [Actinomycetota bacterium]
MTDTQTTAPPQPPAPQGPPPTQPPPDVESKGRFRFPSAFTVLVFLAVVMWALTFVIPAGEYKTNSEGGPIPGTYHEVPAPLNFKQKTEDLFLSPVNGLYGNEEAKSGYVEPEPSGPGFLFGSAGVFLFVLAIGGFIAVMFGTGALDRGIARLAYRVRDRGWLMIVAIMVVFSILGSVEGMSEETLGFYGLIVPLMLALGYDRMVAVGVIMLGAGVGVMGSTVNPFSIGIASGFAGVSIGDGIGLRLVMWIVLTAITIAYVARYAHRVLQTPGRSLVGFAPGDRERAAATASEAEPPALTDRHKLVIAGVVLTFAFMIFSIIPWAEIFSGSGAEPYSWELDWWFPQLTVLFIVAAVLLGILGGLGEKRITDTMSHGAADILAPALIIVFARGITVIMHNNAITDSVLHAMESVASGTSQAIFAPLIFLVNLPLAFLIPSTSGHATLAMPILAPLGDFANVSRSLVITAWNAASGWINLITPTSGVVMGGIALAKVGYDRYVRFIAPLLAILFVVTAAFLAGAALIE